MVFQHGPRASRRVALTFDDGPGPLTAKYLEVLGRAGVRASFFVIGQSCQPHRAELDEAVRRGHDVAGHGWSHTPFPQLGRSALERELRQTAAVLPPSVAARSMVRPPRGRMTARSLLTCCGAGYTSAMWSFDPLDGDARTADDVARAVDPSKLAGGDIILLHEDLEATLDALPSLIERIRRAGFELASVSELLRG